MPRSYAYVAPCCCCCSSCNLPAPPPLLPFLLLLLLLLLLQLLILYVCAGNSQIERTEITLASTQATRRLDDLLHLRLLQLASHWPRLPRHVDRGGGGGGGEGRAGQCSAGGQAAGLFGRTRTRPLALGNLAGPQCSCNPSCLLPPDPIQPLATCCS